MLDLIKQNPLVALLLIIVPVVAAVWKIFEALYVKPRDFRISTLEKNVEEMRVQMVRRVSESTTLPAAQEAVVTPPQLRPATTQRPLPSAQATTAHLEPLDPLRSLEECHKAWKREGQTELQIKHFEDKNTGRHVSWEVFIDSIDKSKYSITVHANAHSSGYDHASVLAYFPLSEEVRLLEFREGDRVRISGPIKKFFLSPTVEPAQIERI